MLRIIFVIILIINTIYAKSSYTQKFNECCYENLGLIYIKDSDTLYTGIIIKREKFGLMAYTNIIAGERSGEMKVYYNNKKLYMLRHYNDGYIDGVEKIYNVKGSIIKTTIYSKNKIINSKNVVYYQNSNNIAGLINIRGQDVTVKSYKPDGTFIKTTSYKLK